MQSYVSDQLTHFVGRSRPDDQARFELLLQILRGGVLLDPRYSGKRDTPIFHFDVETPEGLERETFYPDPYFEVRPHASIDTNEFVAAELVCFCDIPVDQLRIHTTKYSRFGLAFAKPFLIAQGAHPVWYVAKSAATEMELVSSGEYADFFSGELASSSRGAFFERMKERLFETSERDRRELQAAFSNYKRGRDDAVALRRRLLAHTDFMIGMFAYVFGYLKTFDPSLPEEHPDNYYMEREWRVIGKVNFSPSDIRQLLLPSEFAKTFRAEYPAFAGDVIEL